MELKYRDRQEIYYIMLVLIVPLWNWNKDGTDGKSAIESFNCTFMELK